jgi:tyrosyl-DNA phosphodiesterase-1
MLTSANAAGGREYPTRHCPNFVVRWRAALRGTQRATVSTVASRRHSFAPRGAQIHTPPVANFGTHHSKAVRACTRAHIHTLVRGACTQLTRVRSPRVRRRRHQLIVCYRTHVRVCVTTANFLAIDWGLKTEGVWMQDFPLKASRAAATSAVPAQSSSDFEDTLVAYLAATGWPGGAVPGCGVVTPAFLRRFDFSGARAALVGSVPGAHGGAALAAWGHRRLRALLAAHTFDAAFVGAPLVYQFSSQGSVRAETGWQAAFRESLSAGASASGGPLGVGQERIVWPTEEEVRTSLEGWAGGTSIPGSRENVRRDNIRERHCRWAHADAASAAAACPEGRARALPHIKTFLRHAGTRLAWLLLGSHNMSMAAWGQTLKSRPHELKIMSYELGVLFLPSLAGGSGAGGVQLLTTAGSGGSGALRAGLSSDGRTLALPLPYALPPVRYGPHDVPWDWETPRAQPDVHGRTFPGVNPRHG